MRPGLIWRSVSTWTTYSYLVRTIIKCVSDSGFLEKFSVDGFHNIELGNFVVMLSNKDILVRLKTVKCHVTLVLSFSEISGCRRCYQEEVIS